MTYQELLDHLRKHYQSLLPTFDKQEEQFQCLRTYRQGRLHGVFTRDYWRRKDLFKKGEIVFGYAFKSYQLNVDDESDFPIWVLLSPHQSYAEDPSRYEEILEKINAFLEKKPHGKKEKRLYSLLSGELSEPKYVELPSEWSHDILVYLCSTYVRPIHIYDFRLGILPFLMLPSETKEIMILPVKYWTEEYLQFYTSRKGEKEHD